MVPSNSKNFPNFQVSFVYQLFPSLFSFLNIKPKLPHLWLSIYRWLCATRWLFIGDWCNGNTLEFDSSIPSSSLGSLTTTTKNYVGTCSKTGDGVSKTLCGGFDSQLSTPNYWGVAQRQSNWLLTSRLQVRSLPSQPK